MATPSAPPPPPPPPPSMQLSSPVSVVDPRYCVDYPVDLTITQKALSLSDGDYAITDINGNILFRVKGKAISLRGRRSLIDVTGNTILTMRGKIRTMHDRWEVFRGESVEEKDLIFSVKRSKLIQFKTVLDVFLAANTSETLCDFRIRGNRHERSVTVFLGDTNGILAQLLSMHCTWHVFKGDSDDPKDLLFSVKKSSLIQFKTQLDVFLATNTTDKVCDFRVKGNKRERSVTVCLGDTNGIIAQMKEQYQFKSTIIGQDVFGVTVYPNVDYAFVAALIVILDDIDKSEK